jgi:glycosyltransferase involved in cell wall biosynthesis
MKIAFFHELTPLSGARKTVDEYGKILGKVHKVDLYYVDDKEDKNVSQIFNKVNYFKFRSNNSRLYRDSVELIKLYFLHRKIAMSIKDNRYDLVFVSPSRYTQSPFLLRFIKKSVYFCQEPLRLVYDPLMKIPQNINSLKKYYELINRIIRKIIDKGNISKAGLVLANSKFSKSNILKAYGIDARICYLGVDTQRFFPKNNKKPYDLLFIGDKSSIEGYDLLEESLKGYIKQPIIQFVVRNEEGEGIDEDILANMINKSKIVLALSKGEPFGLIPVEAMSCGVPVIAVSEGGLKESVVNGVTGYLIARDSLDLKRKIGYLLNNESLRKKLGKNARELVLSKFTWNESVARFLRTLKEAGYKTG